MEYIDLECAYCYNLGTSLDVPDVADDDMWDILAGEHDPDCEWITTRAHRVIAETNHA
ncbi:MAG: hypothetical protein O2821_12765 [Chloroflexi bacterium]|nr:hypothetical protein [Chloroflexota bacterium]